VTIVAFAADQNMIAMSFSMNKKFIKE